MRHRLEYTPGSGAALAAGAAAASCCARAGRAGRAGVLRRSIARHRRVALANLEQCFPHRTERELRAIAREMFRHFGRLLFEMLKFSTLSQAAMLRRVEFEGEDRARLAYAQGRGRAVLHRPLRLLGAARDRARAAAAAHRRARAGAGQSAFEHAARSRCAGARATASSIGRVRCGACSRRSRRAKASRC